jgi:hypothetical protein
MEASPSDANSGLVFVNFNQDFGCFAAVTSDGFRIFNSDPLRQNKTECKSFTALAECAKNDGENTLYLGPALSDVVQGRARAVKVKRFVCFVKPLFLYGSSFYFYMNFLMVFFSGRNVIPL